MIFLSCSDEPKFCSVKTIRSINNSQSWNLWINLKTCFIGLWCNCFSSSQKQKHITWGSVILTLFNPILESVFNILKIAIKEINKKKFSLRQLLFLSLITRIVGFVFGTSKPNFFYYFFQGKCQFFFGL